MARITAMTVLDRTRLARRRGPWLATLLPLLVTSCGGLHLDEYANASPHFDPFVFFPGKTRAWGIVQDWRGRLVRRFEVDIEGRVENDELLLGEDFRYADGEISNREWRIKRNGERRLKGTARDILGTAAGGLAGNSMRWRYSMNLRMNDKEYTVHFDDWIWQLDSSVLVNRSYIRKFGLTVAEVTIFMRKQGD